MARKKRHHYIPKFYLEGFVDPRNKPFLWIYEKGGSKIIKASAKDIAVEKHYFSFLDSKDERDSETLENALAEIEGRKNGVTSRHLTHSKVLKTIIFPFLSDLQSSYYLKL